MKRALLGFTILALFWLRPLEAGDPHAVRPRAEELLRPRSLTRVIEELDVVTNAEWVGEQESDFGFTNAVLIRAPLRYAHPLMLDLKLFPKMSSAIKKFEEDPKTGLIELEGEAQGLRLHSWIRADRSAADVIRYDIVRGDLVGFHVDAFLWERSGKTLAIAKGSLPRARAMLPKTVAFVFKPVSEIVLGIATKNFRSYIEEEYKKQRKDSAL